MCNMTNQLPFKTNLWLYSHWYRLSAFYTLSIKFQDHNKAKSSEYKIGSVFFNTLIKAKENNLRSNYIITHLPNWLNGKKL